MRIAVIDVECTCNDNPSFGIEDYEVIEIGAIACDISEEGLAIIDCLQMYVKPTTRPVLTPFCVQLTGITQSVVDRSKTLHDACPALNKWLIKNNVIAWVSWGNDKSVFIIDCKFKSIENPFKDVKHFDLKRVFTQKFGQRAGMKRALSFFSIPFEGRHHSAYDDAKNVVNLLSFQPVLREEIFTQVKKLFDRLSEQQNSI